MCQLQFAAGVGVHGGELVVAGFGLAVEEGAGPDGGGLDEVKGGLVYGHGVGAGQEADVGDDGGVAPGGAVAVGHDLGDDVDIEGAACLAVEGAQGVFGHLFGELGEAHVPVHAYGFGGADGHALAAAYAGFLVDAGLCAFSLDEGGGGSGADGDALAAGDAFFLLYLELDAVLLALAYEGGAAHGDVLNGAAEAGHFVSFYVGHDDHAACVQDARRYLGGLEAGAGGGQGYLAPVVALESIGYDDGGSADFRHEAVGYGGLQVVHGVGAGTGVEGVGVGKEGFCALGAGCVCGGPGKDGADVGVVAQFAKVYLDGAEVSLADGVRAGLVEFGQEGAYFGQRAGFGAPRAGVQVVNGCCHGSSSKLVSG